MSIEEIVHKTGEYSSLRYEEDELLRGCLELMNTVLHWECDECGHMSKALLPRFGIAPPSMETQCTNCGHWQKKITITCYLPTKSEEPTSDPAN